MQTKVMEMGLRILLVSDNYPPFIGGAHRQTQLLAHELQGRGHSVSVATVWHGGMPDQEDDAGVTVYRLRQLRTWLPALVRDGRQQYQPPFPDPVTIWQLRGIINQFQPDVIHAYGWFTYSAAAALLGKRIPLLISARDYGYSCATRTLLYRDQACSGPAPLKCLNCAGARYGLPKGWVTVLGVYLGRPLLRRKVTGMHSVSTYVQQMTRRDFLDDRVASGRRPLAHPVIPSFREDDEGSGKGAALYGDRADLRGYLEQLPSTPFMLFVGALRLMKGLKPLLAAYERLCSPPPLVLIGTIESDTPRAFPPGVVILKKFPHQAVMAAWDRCLFGVLPSLGPEPLGSVVYEGMSRGKAVIGTTPGGHTDMIVHGETGFLVPPGDVAALVDAMQRLIAKPDLRERFGQAGRARAGLFTAEVVVPHFEQVYRQLVAESTGRINENHSLPLGQR